MAEMAWGRFLALRARLRRWRCLGGALAAAASLGVEGALLSLPVVDAGATARLGVDPLVAVGAAAAAGVLASYAAGAALVSLAWRLLQPRAAAALDARQRAFVARIERLRAPASVSAATVGDPLRWRAARRADPYGVRIASLSDFRRWLRVQRALRRGECAFV